MNIIQEGGGGNGGDGNDQSQPQPPPAQPPPAQRCPRCDSVNTKFCYYNNYSLSQPRYFCKTCKRYWTQGGTLRNIPIGGGCRKGKRTKTTSFAASSSSPAIQLMTRQSSQPNPMMTAPRGLIGPTVGPAVTSYYQGGGYLSSHQHQAAMIHSQNQLSQPLFNLSSLNMATPPSSSSNIHHPWFNASSSSSRSHIPPPPMPSVFQSDESVYVSDDNQQGGVVQTSMNMNMNMMMGNSGYASSLNDWSQNNSLWSTVSTISIRGDNNSGSPSNNDDRSNDINGNNKAGGSSSSLSGNPWPRLP